MYLRQVDAPGVDTKFIERHKGVLAELLDAQLDSRGSWRARPTSPGATGSPRPGYVRFRVAGGFRGFPSCRSGRVNSPMRPRASPGPCDRERDHLPRVPGAGGAMVIFGGGYAVPVLEPLGWLAGLDVGYWGDLDTHGFAILNRLRHHLPHARSMLMDRATLLDHRDHWTTEPSPTAAVLSLDAAEQLSTTTSSSAIQSGRPPRTGTDQLRLPRSIPVVRPLTAIPPSMP